MSSILYICLTSKSGTFERMVLNDCFLLKKQGFNPILYCLSASYLDVEAELHGIPRIHYRGKGVHRFWDLKNFLDLRRILSTYNISLVNCYDEYSIWILCLLIRKRVMIPLILSLGKVPRRSFHSLFYRFLFSRVDLIMVPDKSFAEKVWDCYPVKAKRVTIFRQGIDWSERKATHSFSHLVRNDYFLIGSTIDRHVSDTSFLTPAFEMMKALKRQLQYSVELKNRIKFVVAHEKRDNSGIFLKTLMEKVREYELDADVFLMEEEDIANVLHHLNLWIGHGCRDMIDDYVLKIICLGRPCLLPRSATSLDFFKVWPGCGETYRPGDPRELKDKCLKIVSRYKFYTARTLEVGQQLRQIHDGKSRGENLVSQYEVLWNMRRRLVKLRARFERDRDRDSIH